jgi:hypothetical protein
MHRSFHFFTQDEATPHRLVAVKFPVFRTHERPHVCINHTAMVTGYAHQCHGMTRYALDDAFNKGLTHVYSYSWQHSTTNDMFYLTISGCRVLVGVDESGDKPAAA